jgi:hypothetical protein
MFYSQKDESSSAESPLKEERQHTQLLADLELLYDKYRPRCDNPLFESFNAFMLNVINEGVKVTQLEPLYRQVAEVPFYKLRNSVNNFAKQAGELLARSECDEDLTYMQELSQYGLDGPYQS